MVEPVRWGIAGFGWVARDFMAPAIATVGDRLVAVCDRDPSVREIAARLGARTYESFEALASDPDVDAVYVATPNYLHRTAVEPMARAGKAVLCEKPIAATIEDAEAIVATCRRAGVLYGTAFDQRHHPAHRALRDGIGSGLIGTVTAVRIVYACWLGPDWQAAATGDNWRIVHSKAGGGALIDLAPHGIDLIDFLLDEPIVSLRALMQRRVHSYAVDDGGMLIGRTEGGVLASLHVSYNMPEALPRRRLEVVGTLGSITAENTMGQDPGGKLTLMDAAAAVTRPLTIPEPTLSPFAGQVRAFDEALRGKGNSTSFDGERDLVALRMILDACAAHDAQPRGISSGA